MGISRKGSSNHSQFSERPLFQCGSEKMLNDDIDPLFEMYSSSFRKNTTSTVGPTKDRKLKREKGPCN
jgi:hypothetical protein